ncbi:acyl-CoA-binding protein homolog [Tachypleus tridentatus]|uniref:acyl-CoA-binding protein homolog n=1 Tax=Tachypleus tridentatus TaxID=6853 RepID=UPI003FCF3A36
MSLDEKFNKAAEDVNKLKSRPTDEELLELYALYKQSTIGDCNTERPGVLELKGKAKWDSWNSKKGISQDSAKEAYITKANQLMERYGVN